MHGGGDCEVVGLILIKMKILEGVIWLMPLVNRQVLICISGKCIFKAGNEDLLYKGSDLLYHVPSTHIHVPQEKACTSLNAHS